MTDDLILRPARDADMAQLQALSAQARARYATLPGLAHVVASPPLGADRFAACRIVVAAYAEAAAPVGFAMTRPLDGLLYLDNISVDAGHSGRRIGFRLLDDVMSEAVAAGVPAVALTTFREPAWNGPWFRRHGFRPMPDDRMGPGLRGVMERQARTLDPEMRETLWRPCGGRETRPARA